MTKEQVKTLIDSLIEESCEKQGRNFSELQLDASLNLVESRLFDSIDFLGFIGRIEEELDKELDLFDYDPEEFTNYERLIEIISES